MSIEEARQLRTFSEHRALKDIAQGRKTGVLSWMVVDLALSTGLRVSEMANLRIGDVDLKRGALKVRRLKRKKPLAETLAISPELLEHLKEFIAWKDTVGESIDKKGSLFIGKRGPLTAQGLQQIWKAEIKRAGLPKDLSIHCARHTMAVHLLRKTKNLRQVQKQLGHASPATTANMYADVPFEDMKDGVSGLYDE